MREYLKLEVLEKRWETPDAIVLRLKAAEESRNVFAYAQGQHLPVRAQIDGRSVRRTYSICASVNDADLRLGIRVQPGGVFSNYLALELEPGDFIEAMPPSGHFNTPLDPQRACNYAAFAAGSGITPVLSILKTTLETEPKSRFTLFYGNRSTASTMFIEDLLALKNLFPERLALHFIFSRQPSDLPIYDGRLDAERAGALYDAFLAHLPPGEVFVCGPDTMIDEVTRMLLVRGLSSGQVHAERFRPLSRDTAVTAQPAVTTTPAGEPAALVRVIQDGHEREFSMPRDGTCLVDGAAAAGLELPYSCKGGVCSTCRTHLRHGEVTMQTNYALEDWELAQGYVLACQAVPVSAELVLDYDRS
jgi:ring-1,2-phenylacetyl-CoA epoxidase subunit PaaE